MVKKIFLALDIEKTGCKNLAHPICAIGWCLGSEAGEVLEKGRINLRVQWPQREGGTWNYGDFEPRCWDEFWSKQPAALRTLLTQNTLRWPKNAGGTWNYGDFEPQGWDEFWSEQPTALCTLLARNTLRWPKMEGGTWNYGDFEPRCWDEFWSKQPTTLRTLLTQDAMEQKQGMAAFAGLLERLELAYPGPEYKIKFLSDNASFDIAALDVNLEKVMDRVPLRYSSRNQYRAIEPPDDMLDVFPAAVVKRLLEQEVSPYVSHDHDPANDAEHIYRQYLLVLRLKAKLTGLPATFWDNAPEPVGWGTNVVRWLFTSVSAALTRVGGWFEPKHQV